MYFTREDILKIQKALLQIGTKDSEFKNAQLPLQEQDIIAVVQDGANRKVKVNDIIGQFNLLNRQDFINVSDMYDEHYITINEAIKLMPQRKRKEGLVITFQNTSGKWQIYQFKGTIDQFVNPIYWEDLFGLEYPIINSIIPDEEDLTMSKPDKDGNSLLSFKDKNYDPEGFSGMATKILRKNIVEVNGVKKNILTQEDFDQENCIYEIRYDFTLTGNVTIPANCILEFNGGSLSGAYTIIGHNTFVKGLAESFLKNNITILGTWNVEDLILPKETDVTALVQKMLDLFGYVKFGIGKYYLSDTIIIRNNFSTIIGCGSSKTYITPLPSLQSTITNVFKTLLPGEEGTDSGRYYIAERIIIKDLSIIGIVDTRRIFEDAIIVNGPSSVIENVNISNINGFGIEIGCWCNRIINCVIDHYSDTGIKTGGNGPCNNLVINKCRIESGEYGIKLSSGGNIVIRDNTIEGNSKTDVYVRSSQNIVIEGNYFEGTPLISKENVNIQNNSEAADITDDIKAHIIVAGGIVGGADISVGPIYCPCGVSIRKNFIESNIGQDKNIVAIGSCCGYLTIEDNVSRYNRTVAKFLDFGSSMFSNVTIKGNVGFDDTKDYILTPIDLATSFAYVQSSWQGAEHFKGDIVLDNPDKVEYIIGNNINIWGIIREEFLSRSTQSLKQIDGEFIIEADFSNSQNINAIGFPQTLVNSGIYRFECDVKLLSGAITDNSLIIIASRYQNGTSDYSNNCNIVITPTTEWKHVILNISVPNGIIDNVGISINNKLGNNKYLIKNPIMYKVGLNKPDIKYYIQECANIYQNNPAIEGFNTRNSQIGIRGLNKNGEPCIVTNHGANGYDTWSTIQSVLNL